MEWFPVGVQGNDRWPGSEMRPRFSFHHKSIRVDHMNQTHTLTHLMESSGGPGKEIDKMAFCQWHARILCVYVCVVKESEQQRKRKRERHFLHSHKHSPVILTESFRQLGWNHIPLKWKTSLTQGTSLLLVLLLIFPLFVAAERQYLWTPRHPLGAVVWTGISFSSADILWASGWLCHRKEST